MKRTKHPQSEKAKTARANIVKPKQLAHVVGGASSDVGIGSGGGSTSTHGHHTK